jgi:PAS domain-containing protein
MPQLVWTAGSNGKVDYVNSFYEKCTGLSPETATSLIYDMIHPDDAKLFNEAWRYATHTAQPLYRVMLTN